MLQGFRKSTWVGQVPTAGPWTNPTLGGPSVSPAPAIPNPTILPTGNGSATPAPVLPPGDEQMAGFDRADLEGFARLAITIGLWGLAGGLVGRAINPKYTLAGAGVGVGTRLATGAVVGPWLAKNTPVNGSLFRAL